MGRNSQVQRQLRAVILLKGHADLDLAPATEAELAEREGRTYESAEQLLQRIRAARTELGVKKRSVQTKRRRKA